MERAERMVEWMTFVLQGLVHGWGGEWEQGPASFKVAGCMVA